MAYEVSGDLAIGRALGLGVLTTTQRTAAAYTPAAGHVVFDSTDKKIYQYDGTKWSPLFAQKNNFAATVDPTPNDDANFGYSVGSYWIDTTANRAWVCVDSSATAAIWKVVDQPKHNFTAGVDPVPANDHAGLNYQVGSRWVNTITGDHFVCVKIVTGTTPSATWIKTNTTISTWTMNTPYSAGETVIAPDGSLIKAVQDRPATGTFDLTEAGTANWTRLGQVAENAYTGSIYYYAGTRATDTTRIIERTAAGVSATALSITGEAAKWKLISQSTIGTWANATVYFAGELISVSNVIYKRNSTGTTSATPATFDATEMTNWTQISASSNPRFHLTNTVVSPATAGQPTLAEITTIVGTAHPDTLVYYTGDDNAASTPTHVYFVDSANTVTQIEHSELKNNYAATAAPSATDDSAAGYAVGSAWIDTTNDDSYVCVDATATSAVWKKTSAIKHNFATNAAPGNTNDGSTTAAGGYSVGSIWYDSSTTNLWICTDNTTNNAKWEPINTLVNNFNATAAPTASTGSSTNGYEVGSMWVDIIARQTYICVIAHATAPVWERIDSPKFNVTNVAPTATNDSAPTTTTPVHIGEFEVGSLWFDTAKKNTYVCLDATANAAVWIKMGTGSNLVGWSQPVDYYAGQAVIGTDGSIITANTDRFGITAFDATEAANWTRIGQADVKAWATGIYYYAPSKAVVKNNVTATRTTSGASLATFTSTEAGNWTYDSQQAIKPFVGGEVYLGNEMMVYGGVIYRRLATGTAGGAFNATEKALWTQITGSTYEHLIADATTAWGTAATGLYTITVAAATHGIVNPTIVQVYEKVGTDYDLVQVDRQRILANGDVAISVSDIPDGRFIGKIAIS